MNKMIRWFLIILTAVGANLIAQIPDSTTLHIKKLFSEYQYNKAVRILEEVSNPELQSLLAEAYEKAGQQSQALRLYKSLLEKDTSNKEILMRLGKLRAKTGNLKGAYSNFETLTQLYPENAYFHKLSGAIAKRDVMTLGVALSHYQQAKILNPADEETAFDLASIYTELQQYASARAITQEILKTDSGNTSILLLDCRIAYLQKRYPDVKKSGALLLNRGDTITSNLRLYAFALYHLGHYDDAIRWLKRLEIQTPSEQVYFYLSMAHYRLEQYDAAELDMEKAIEETKSPSLAQYHTRLGIIHEIKEEYAAAIDSYKTAYNINSNQDLLYRLARVSDEYYKDDRIAETYYEEFLTKKDTNETPQHIYSEERLSEIKKVRFFKKDTI